jgi:hypothetical protein
MPSKLPIGPRNGDPVTTSWTSACSSRSGGLHCASTSSHSYIGDNREDFTTAHVWSQPFFVNPDPTDSGTVNPGDGTPEVLMAMLQPVAATGLLGGTVLIRRRRAVRATHKADESAAV